MQKILKPQAAHDLEIQPPEPPDELSEDEAIEWRNIVSQMPPDYFQNEVFPILIELCRHICLSRFYYGKLQMLNKRMGVDKKSIGAALQMARMHTLESKVVAQLLGRLGVTKRTREGREKKAVRNIGGRRPWELSRAYDEENLEDLSNGANPEDFEQEYEQRAENKATSGY
jgi:hypothetical protein